MELSTSIRFVPHVGPVLQKRLEAMGIATVRDLLFYFPRTYEDWSVITPIRNIKEGTAYCLCGTIKDIRATRTFKKHLSITSAILEDESGAVKLLWFNQPYLTNALPIGQKICVAGKVTRDKYGVCVLSPSYEKREETAEGSEALLHTGRLVPVYNESAGISSKFLRSLVGFVLRELGDAIADPIPAFILREKTFPAIADALGAIHFPRSPREAEDARRRFAFEELLLVFLFILSERKRIASVKAPPIPFSAEIMKKFTDSLPFQLTDAQKKSAWHILKDMEKPRPMNRLLQGDVGSGKTVVAAMAALSVLKARRQAAFLAPTEILARQHFKTLSQLLRPFKVDIGFLTGKADQFISKKLPDQVIEISRKKILEKAKNGELPILVGTHALIQKEVRFGNLGLLVVDEQHRFGVRQRAELLRRASLIPHLLSMTATPIPRTLAMTIYGDLDLSVIDELPKGRKKIITKIVPPESRDETYRFIRAQVKEGRQVFVVCPRIDPGASGKNSYAGQDGREEDAKPRWSEAKAVKEEYEKLSKHVFPDLSVGMLHGKMAGKEKEEAMRMFKRGKTDVLVSTSVIEVGVDIPNASVMMIDGAEYFGFAQLHQFRGRVGRSDHQSYCFLFSESGAARRRLRALEKTDSGFELAEMDLKLRGPGDFAGVKQWGIPDFAMDQLTNKELTREARDAAEKILDEDITLNAHPLLRGHVERLKKLLHLE